MDELEYWTQIKKGRINRRGFMGRAAVGSHAAMATTLLSNAGVAATPKKGHGGSAWRAAPPPTRSIRPAIPTPARRCRSGASMSAASPGRRRRQRHARRRRAMEPGDDARPGSSRSAGNHLPHGKDLTADDVIASLYHGRRLGQRPNYDGGLRHRADGKNRWCSAFAPTPTSRTSAATITFRSCPRSPMAPPTGSQACGPGRSCSGLDKARA